MIDILNCTALDGIELDVKERMLGSEGCMVEIFAGDIPSGGRSTRNAANINPSLFKELVS